MLIRLKTIELSRNAVETTLEAEKSLTSDVSVVAGSASGSGHFLNSTGAPNGCPRNVTVLSSLLMQKLCGIEAVSVYRPEALNLTWISQKVSDLRWILVPINVLKVHWVLVTLDLDTKEGESGGNANDTCWSNPLLPAAHYYDSSLQNEYVSFCKVRINNLLRWLKATSSINNDDKWTFIVHNFNDVPQQVGGCDCGEL